jgi:hypothetical protein
VNGYTFFSEKCDQTYPLELTPKILVKSEALIMIGRISSAETVSLSTWPPFIAWATSTAAQRQTDPIALSS